MINTHHTFEHDGKQYHVALITQRVKNEFSRWAFDRVRQLIFAMKEGLSKEEYKAELDRHNRDWINGKYDFESKRVSRMLMTTQGMIQLGTMLFGCSDDVFVSLLLERKEDVLSVIRLVIAESFPSEENSSSVVGG